MSWECCPQLEFTKKNAGVFSYLTSISMLCASGLGLSRCQHSLHQNKMTSKYFGSPSSEPCFITLGSQRNERSLLSSKLFLHLSGYAANCGNQAIGFTFFYYWEEHLTNLNFLLFKDRIERLFSFCQIPPIHSLPQDLSQMLFCYKHCLTDIATWSEISLNGGNKVLWVNTNCAARIHERSLMT